MNKDKKKKIIMTIFLVLLAIGIGYAAFNSNLNINGTTTILNNNFSVKFLNVIEKSGSVTATTPAAIDEETGTTVSFAAQLEKPGDYYGFSIDITNDGTLDAMVDSVTMTELTEAQKKYLTYEIMDKDGLKVNNKDLLIKGETRTVTILVSYKAEPEDYPEGIKEILGLSFSINYVEANSTAIDPTLRVSETALMPIIQSEYSDLSSRSGVVLGAGSFGFTNTSIIANKTITKINIPVITVKSLTEEQCLTMTIIDETTFTLGQPATEKRQKQICISPDQLSKYDSTTIKDYIMVDIEDEYITDGEFPVFGASNDDINFAYIMNCPTELETYNNVSFNGTSKIENYGILMDIYVKKEGNYNPLEGKKLSILGDSISTFDGYSNNKDYNSTLNSGNTWYSTTGIIYDMTGVNDTWWMQTIDELGMTLNVNNSISGSRVFATSNAGYKRATELDNNDDVAPDIIALWMGINDVRDALDTLGTFESINFDTLKSNGTYITPTTFAEAYAITIDKMINKYEDVDIYCFTLLPAANNPTEENLLKTNDIIRKVANHYNVNIVDLYNDSGITSSNWSNYLGDGLHPKKAGMDAIAQTFINKLKEEYGMD